MVIANDGFEPSRFHLELISFPDKCEAKCIEAEACRGKKSLFSFHSLRHRNEFCADIKLPDRRVGEKDLGICGKVNMLWVSLSWKDSHNLWILANWGEKEGRMIRFKGILFAIARSHDAHEYVGHVETSSRTWPQIETWRTIPIILAKTIDWLAFSRPQSRETASWLVPIQSRRFPKCDSSMRSG
jgi:hypothetical protein